MNSMTGFGTGKAVEDGTCVCCEIKSVNQKGLDVKVKTSRECAHLESMVLDQIKQGFSRGRFDVSITLSRDGDEHRQWGVHREMVDSVLGQLRDCLSLHPQIEDRLTMGDLLQLPGLVVPLEREPPENLMGAAEKALQIAIEDVKESRRKEGQGLRGILEAQLTACEALLQELNKRSVKTPEQLKTRLVSRLAMLDQSVMVDEGRLAQEVLLMTERIDVTEELDRLRIHVKHFRDLLNAESSVGRKLDFLCQELFREANTLGSKAADAAVAHLVVDIKSEIQKIREQVQNIE